MKPRPSDAADRRRRTWPNPDARTDEYFSLSDPELRPQQRLTMIGCAYVIAILVVGIAGIWLCAMLYRMVGR